MTEEHRIWLKERLLSWAVALDKNDNEKHKMAQYVRSLAKKVGRNTMLTKTEYEEIIFQLYLMFKQEDKRKVIGYTVYNPSNVFGLECIAAEEGEVFSNKMDAKKERDRIAKTFNNEDLEVVEIKELGD